MNKTMTLGTILLLAATALAFAPTASAHTCVLDYGADCAADCGNDGRTHVHWGPRLLPCVSAPTVAQQQLSFIVGVPGEALLP